MGGSDPAALGSVAAGRQELHEKVDYPKKQGPTSAMGTC